MCQLVPHLGFKEGVGTPFTIIGHTYGMSPASHKIICYPCLWENKDKKIMSGRFFWLTVLMQCCALSWETKIPMQAMLNVHTGRRFAIPSLL